MNDISINDQWSKIKNAEMDPHIDEILYLIKKTKLFFPDLLVRASSYTPNVVG